MTHESDDATRLDETATELTLTRVLNAPREIAWKAWTDPGQIGAWFGPTGFTTITERMDVRPGGQWRFVMRGPDGTEYPNLVSYEEVVEPSRLAYRHGGEAGGAAGTEGVSFRVTVSFEPEGPGGARTRLTMRMVFPDAKQKDLVAREYGAIEGAKQNLARLAEHVQSRDAGDPPFVIRRVLRVPRERAWRAWTDRDELLAWFGPKGMPLTHCALELKPGGVMHYRMTGPGGADLWGRWAFREIVENERLVFVTSFSDPAGGVTRAPFADKWPLEMLTTVTFEEHAGLGRGTLVTVTSSAVDHDPVARKTFLDGHESMTMGWGGTLDQLGAWVEKGSGVF